MSSPNWRQGLFRIWAVTSALWVIGVFVHGWSGVSCALKPGEDGCVPMAPGRYYMPSDFGLERWTTNSEILQAVFLRALVPPIAFIVLAALIWLIGRWISGGFKKDGS